MPRHQDDRATRTEEFAFLSALAAGLAHEIRNPLSTMTVNLQLLREDFDHASTPEGQRAYRKVEILLHETKRLERIVNDFLRFAGRYHLELEDQDLSAVIEDILDFVEADLTAHRVRLVRQLGRGLPLVSLDRSTFRQAILNVLINARQAMPEGGEIAVRTFARAAGVALEIHDTGPGIPAENLPRIFTVFFSTKKEGTGLGLPIAKRIIEEHDGSIAVASDPERGTTFTIVLPRAEGELVDTEPRSRDA